MHLLRIGFTRTIAKLDLPTSFFDSVLDQKACNGLWTFLRALLEMFLLFLELGICSLTIEGPGQKEIYKCKNSLFSSCSLFRMLAL